MIGVIQHCKTAEKRWPKEVYWMSCLLVQFLRILFNSYLHINAVHNENGPNCNPIYFVVLFSPMSNHIHLQIQLSGYKYNWSSPSIVPSNRYFRTMLILIQLTYFSNSHLKQSKATPMITNCEIEFVKLTTWISPCMIKVCKKYAGIMFYSQNNVLFLLFHRGRLLNQTCFFWKYSFGKPRV